MGLFSEKKRVPPKKFGALLAEIVRDVLAVQLDRQNLLKTQQWFIGQGWEFDYPRYFFETLNLYVRLTQSMLIKHYATHKRSKDMIDSFMDALPDEFHRSPTVSPADDVNMMLSMMKSDQPHLTLARIAAQRYFGPTAGFMEITHFGALANALNSVLTTFQTEVEPRNWP